MRIAISDDVSKVHMNRTGRHLDDIDQRLVGLLRRDARRPTASLARELNLSRTAIQARITRLESDGIILGYVTIIAPDAVAGVNALVTITLTIRPCCLVTDQFASWPEVEKVYSIAGDRDAVLVVSVASPQLLSQLADRIQGVDGVGSVETTVVLSERTGNHTNRKDHTISGDVAE